MEQKTRYSDEELQEFKEIILEKLAKAQHEYDNLMAELGSDDHETTFKALEEGASTLGKEASTRMAERQAKFIQHLKAALMRIENGTYGIDRATGQLIPKERLRAVPHATLSIDQKIAEKKH
ncbi:MAG: TraR/DksA family transcriptional regulator [Muribaculaceae bacterium]|nr:TraR/DksA family transcriptional regulator [Muribaculaceae bacterium]